MLVYVDQNILSLQVRSAHTLELPGHTIVYSDAHLGEIARSDRPRTYLDALERIGAKYLTVEIQRGLPTDKDLLFEDRPHAVFESYKHKLSAHPLNADSFLAASAWINGGANSQDVERMASNVANHFKSQCSSLPPALQSLISIAVDEVETQLNHMADEAIDHGNYIEEWRRSIGGGKGGFSGISGDRELLQIWNKIKDKVDCETPEQFFGFEPVDKNSNFKISQCLAITACCGMLDLLGFQAEKKRRKVGKQANVQSDAHHIALAAYCDALFSCDKRLIRRAKAIYEFRDIQTNAVYLKPDGQQ